ncbi:MAG: C39 family peptidase [Bacilli bacterium]|nr:C39 family peptidase [Bacilli bacterium]
MKRIIKYLILFVLILIPIGVSAEDDFGKLTNKMTKSEAIDACVTGDSDAYHCYRYTFSPGITTPMYNTTVWTSKTMGCGFELTDWDYESCKSAALDITYEQCKDKYCRNISHSGYNGTPDFYDKRVSKDKDIMCDNLKSFHILYRAITIMAPILTILFVTFDLVRSIVSGDAKKVSKFRSKLLRRIIALLVLIVLPILIHLLVNTLSKNNVIKDSKMLKCVVLGYNDTDTVKTDPTVTLQPKEIEKPRLITSVKVDGVEVSGFKTTTKSYTITVPNSKTSIDVTATLNSDNAQIISGTGTQELKEGSNTIKIVATADNINYDTITLKVTREKKVETKTNTTTKTNTNTKTTTSTKTYGKAKGSKVIKYSGKNYVVVDTKYPGGVVGYQKMIHKNHIYQDYLDSHKKQYSNISNPGGCCGGISTLQACGLYKGKDVTTANISKGKGKCNNSSNGCSTSFGYGGKCFKDESSFVQYVIKNVRSGHPVIINVTGCKGGNKKCSAPKGTYSRHFVTVVGFKEGSTGTSYKDFLILDSWTGLLKPITSTSRKINGNGIIISNHPCSKKGYNYASVIK